MLVPKQQIVLANSLVLSYMNRACLIYIHNYLTFVIWEKVGTWQTYLALFNQCSKDSLFLINLNQLKLKNIMMSWQMYLEFYLFHYI